MTPEFPRAPMRIGPADVGVGVALERVATAARTVRVMFVPVSPSGTG